MVSSKSIEISEPTTTNHSTGNTHSSNHSAGNVSGLFLVATREFQLYLPFYGSQIQPVYYYNERI